MHFTYKQPQGDLQQGDLLKITDDLRRVLHQFHPHYANNSEYRYLMVLTQSCDLWRRGGNCKARYITLAAVRPVETLIQRELAKHQRSSLEIDCKLCPVDRRYYVKDFLNKLLNNNISEYFYLAADPELDIPSPHVTFLALSVAIKAEHYGICLDARFAQLQEIFQAKLGWLVGDYYSRVATPDWVPTLKNQQEFEAFIDEILDNMSIWVDNHSLAELKAEQDKRRRELGNKIYKIPQEEVFKLLDEYASRQESRLENIVGFLIRQASRTITGIDASQLQKLEQGLINNEELAQLLM
jgi:hypothetical protein